MGLRFEGERPSLEASYLELRRGMDPSDERSDDLLLVAEVSARGFRGSVDCWVLRAAWESFVEQLAELERTRRGEATIEAINPGELFVRVQSTDHAGHVAVGGELGTRRSEGSVTMRKAAAVSSPTWAALISSSV